MIYINIWKWYRWKICFYIIYGNCRGLFMHPIRESFLSLENLGFPLNNIKEINFSHGIFKFPSRIVIFQTSLSNKTGMFMTSLTIYPRLGKYVLHVSLKRKVGIRLIKYLPLINIYLAFRLFVFAFIKRQCSRKSVQ